MLLERIAQKQHQRLRKTTGFCYGTTKTSSKIALTFLITQTTKESTAEEKSLNACWVFCFICLDWDCTMFLQKEFVRFAKHISIKQVVKTFFKEGHLIMGRSTGAKSPY